ncbi:hypothetical protein [Pseudomonas fluvialis]|uniref:hypothetical protein n=1 Tax=Pseudomonas fluvialis TaxID=1793966 RepID=UPI0035B38098
MSTKLEAIALRTEVTDDDMKKLRHMLGVAEHRPKKNWGLRNYFAAGAADVPGLERLVEAGYCVRGAPYMGAHYYHATLAGCAAAGLSKAAAERAFEA